MLNQKALVREFLFAQITHIYIANSLLYNQFGYETLSLVLFQKVVVCEDFRTSTALVTIFWAETANSTVIFQSRSGDKSSLTVGTFSISWLLHKILDSMFFVFVFHIINSLVENYFTGVAAIHSNRSWRCCLRWNSGAIRFWHVLPSNHTCFCWPVNHVYILFWYYIRHKIDCHTSMLVSRRNENCFNFVFFSWIFM